MFARIEASLREASHDFAHDSNPRRPELERLGQWLKTKAAIEDELKLVMICTHNSRRSHLGQFWAAAAADLLGVQLSAFSGGTEATACHPNTLAALTRAGAQVMQLTQGQNPHYRIAYGADRSQNVETWSKAYSDPANPQSGFAAIMFCSDADQDCPFVEGAEARFSLPYHDPKYADNSQQQDAAYDRVNYIIASEMFWLISQAGRGVWV